MSSPAPHGDHHLTLQHFAKLLSHGSPLAQNACTIVTPDLVDALNGLIDAVHDAVVRTRDIADLTAPLFAVEALLGDSRRLAGGMAEMPDPAAEPPRFYDRPNLVPEPPGRRRR